ncbi:ligase-associated DNA damage response endonuclease PdeM [Zavarzinella formosa]|uniref:ligase-associated DNA damage response endonuclease PdeM n=1 Tax=Zavarzinella formosa TaxID=360055 RepID=UPI0002DB7452|nr:ligase-associated DNA damage response endonuclease PdeM [Zavarzinella formosa]
MTTPFELAGELLELRPDRTLYWPRRQTLLLADPHFGKAETFRHAGLPVPGGGADSLNRLRQSLVCTKSERLLILGDFWHARPGRSDRVLAELEQWRREHQGLQIDLIRGNHDRAGDPPPGWGDWHPGLLADPPFVFSHHPTECDEGYTLAGHLHPGFTLLGRGRQRLRLPCFWFGPHCGVLPAFGEFTGLADIAPSPPDRVFVVADDQIIKVDSVTTGSNKPKES